MKRVISLLIVLVLCLGLCACGSTEPETDPTQTEPTQASVKYEDKLIENIKIRDKYYQADAIFGKPVKTHIFEDGSYMIEYGSVTIFDEEFIPTVFANTGQVIYCYEYEFISDSSAKVKVVYKRLIDNFTRLYGEAYEGDENDCDWYFQEGTHLWVYMSSSYPYKVLIKYERS